MTVLRRRWPESHGPVWTADRSRRFESPGAGHARAHDQDFFFFFLLFFLLLFFFFGTFLPFLRASERPMAMACLRLFTLPPFPPLPLLSVPFLRLCIARFTSLPALREYLAISTSKAGSEFSDHTRLLHNCQPRESVSRSNRSFKQSRPPSTPYPPTAPA